MSGGRRNYLPAMKTMGGKIVRDNGSSLPCAVPVSKHNHPSPLASLLVNTVHVVDCHNTVCVWLSSDRFALGCDRSRGVGRPYLWTGDAVVCSALLSGPEVPGVEVGAGAVLKPIEFLLL